MGIRFGDCELDEARRELRRGGALVPVEPQVFDLLAHLIRHRDRVVTRDDMIEGVWGGRIVSESTLSSRINAARRAIGDSGEAQAMIRTIARRGLRFVADVTELAPDAASPVPNAAPPRQEVRFCRTGDGVTLAVASSGKGPVLLRAGTWLTHVEHDWTSPLFAPLLRRFAARHQLVRYDIRGCGLSDHDVGDISFEAFRCDLEAVAATIEAPQFALVASSQGAALAIDFAARHPERVTHLVIIGGFARGRHRRGQPAEKDKAQAILTLMRQGWGDPRSAFMRMFSSMYVPKSSPEQLHWWIDAQRATTSAEAAVRIREAIDEIDVTDLLASVRAPTLVLHGRGDSVAPFEEGRLIAAGIPGARFVELDSDNHVVLEGEPAWSRMTAEIETFLTV
ncbi:alpha/beta fold hydrolase [Neoroseomonas oryzicola]|uniref:Alpha/beta fold hydrolase n=1 Tax=Neoroseomonas oryzicola TaxID=535904 RepID=A0A9X9WEF2_9PROT|nr:alpha/beta fold hydrolase [Neoroseomonas oryzicola]MBR0658712.1 alpha/beta fold hydrolase [Neoroseomonas oryzicola]NKE17852.1 alpha/beta fold hydrolase [Neoroseomonas oryzicola]